MFGKYAGIAQIIMVCLILACSVLSLWIRKNHYKKMAEIRNDHIKVLGDANAALTLNNIELNSHIQTLVKTVQEGSEAIRIIHKRLEEKRTRR